jgi:hypothetical protein
MISERVKKALRKKVEDHNEKHGDDARKKVTLRMLIAVFKRGIGAYNTNPGSVRPTVTSADQWAYARVNAFLYACRTLKFRGGKFDLDLLPSAHPLSSKKSLYKGIYDDIDFTIPKGAKEEAKRGLAWRKEHGRGGTSVGLSSARYIINNTTVSPQKARHIAKYFPRHEIDKRADGYSPGEDGYPSNGRIAWALWGGNAGRDWSNKLVRAMNRRDEQNKFTSAIELIERRNALREMKKESRLNRFENAEVKNDIWSAYDRLLGNWDYVLASVYFDLLKKQVNTINKTLAESTVSTSGILNLLNAQIDRQTTLDWKDELLPYYESMTLDFAYFQVDLLLPDEAKENFVFNETEQEQILRSRRRVPRQVILTEGFYPRRKRGQAIPINNTRYNRSAKAFIEQRLNTFLPDMSVTMKNNLNRSLRKSLDEANKLGLTGVDLDDFVKKGISDSLGKKNLGRAMNIARTEGSALSNWSTNESAKQTGLILEKEWITRRDGLVRDSHLFMDLVRVNQDSDFTVQGYKMNYPGDSSQGAPAGLVCNCRCSMIFHESRI